MLSEYIYDVDEQLTVDINTQTIRILTFSVEDVQNMSIFLSDILNISGSVHHIIGCSENWTVGYWNLNEVYDGYNPTVVEMDVDNDGKLSVVDIDDHFLVLKIIIGVFVGLLMVCCLCIICHGWNRKRKDGKMNDVDENEKCVELGGPIEDGYYCDEKMDEMMRNYVRENSFTDSHSSSCSSSNNKGYIN